MTLTPMANEVRVEGAVKRIVSFSDAFIHFDYEDGYIEALQGGIFPDASGT